MELLHGLVEFAGDVGDGLRGVGFAEKGREHVADLARGDAAQESLQDEAVDHLLAALIARQEAGMKAFAGARYAQARQQTELGDQVAEVEAIAVVQPGEWSVFVIAQFEIAVALGQKGLLNDGFQLGTSHFRPILFKEILELGEVQLKMAVAEDFQFSHQGVPPLGVGSPEKVRPLFLLKNQIYTQKFMPPAVLEEDSGFWRVYRASSVAEASGMAEEAGKDNSRLLKPAPGAGDPRGGALPEGGRSSLAGPGVPETVTSSGFASTNPETRINSGFASANGETRATGNKGRNGHLTSGKLVAGWKNMRTNIEELDSRFYPQFADRWDNRIFREVILNHICPDALVLDLGAGCGFVEFMNFRGVAAKVCGLDPEETVLKNPHLDEAKVGLGEGIPWPEQTFDIVFADSVLEHLANPEAVFREVRRVLKPGGFFLIKTPNRFHYVTLIAQITPTSFHKFVNRLRGRDDAHTFKTYYRANSKRAITRRAGRCGFEVKSFLRIEGRPEYLRFSMPSYYLGIFWERLVNRFDLLSSFRVLILAVLQKAPVPARE